MTEQAHDHHAHGHDDGASFDPETMDWDARYRSEDGAMWSGHVNGTLVDEIGDLPPGSALDVGCGEGADAIWLAQQGWTVTALDVAPTAVERGRAEAERQGVDGIDWIAGDLLADPPNGTFDLVSLQYPAFPISRRDQLSEVLRTAVAPGGVLLLVGHAPPDDPTDSPYDPADWTQPADLVGDLADGWIVERDVVVPRPGDHHHGSHHSEDVVVRARRSV